MSFQLLDTHAHLISDDWETYQARPFTPDEAKNELFETIVAMVDRSARDAAHGSPKAGIKRPAKVMRNGE